MKTSNKEFAHGGDVKAFKKKYKLKRVIDLSSNINFIKPKIKVDFNSLEISAYPSYEKFYKSVAKYFDVKKSQIELYNGASSAIFRFFEVLKPTCCTIYAPAYLEYKRVVEILNIKTKLINRFDNLYEKPKKNHWLFL